MSESAHLEPATNYLTVSDLLLSNAISKKDEIVDQIDQSVIKDVDKQKLGNNIGEKIVDVAVDLSSSENFSLHEIVEGLNITPDAGDNLKKILLGTGIFIESGPDNDSLGYASENLRNIFQHLRDSGLDSETIDFDFKDYSTMPRKLWNIPGQTAMIGPIDKEDSKTLFRFYVLERWKKFREIFQNQTSKNVRELIRSNSSSYNELKNKTLDKMYGIFGGKNGLSDEVGELQGGCFIYRPELNSVMNIRQRPELKTNIEAISGSQFRAQELREISWFKSPYAQVKHMGSGVRQILARENTPTASEKISLDLIFKGGVASSRRLSPIFVAFILPDNEESKRVANSVGMEMAGEMDHVIGGIKEHVEVWILNRDKLNSRIIDDIKKI